MKLYSLDNKFIRETDSFPDNFTGIIECSDGSRRWFVAGQWHRLNGPAMVWPDGTKFWYTYGKRVTELQCKLLHDMMKLKGLADV